jgi:hypothetical protein
VLKWFPVLWDVVTVVLLVAGCLLIWLSLWPRKHAIATAKQTTKDVEPRHSSEFATQEAEVRGDGGADFSAQPLSEEPRGPDAAPEPPMLDQNSYAVRVATAMTKSKKPSG